MQISIIRDTFRLKEKSERRMESMDSEYSLYWETKLFLENQELDSWAFGESIPGLSDHQSSPDGSGTSSSTSPTTMAPTVSAAVAKNIVMERERRRRLNERLYVLRSVVPNITRMDKVSIVKDAITYIQELQEQERRLSAEVEEALKPVTATVGSKRIRSASATATTSPHPSPIEVTEVSEMGSNTWCVSITCKKGKGTVARLCESLKSLQLPMTGATMASFSGRIIHTLFVESEVGEEELKEMIEMAIAEAQ